MVAVDSGLAGLDEVELGAPDERAIAKYPEVGSFIPVPQGFPDGCLVPCLIAQV